MTADVQTHLGVTSFDEPFLQFRGEEMQNGRYTILVHHYLLGQFRINITDLEKPDTNATPGHGAIVQELCTYRPSKLAEVITLLRHSPDPLQLSRSWAKPYNCEREGDRIRLDNKPADRPEACKATV